MPPSRMYPSLSAILCGRRYTLVAIVVAARLGAPGSTGASARAVSFAAPSSAAGEVAPEPGAAA